MTTFTYPHFHDAVVGLAPAEMKRFAPYDMRALVEAFKELTGIDPLAKGVKPHQAWVIHLQGKTADGLATQSGTIVIGTPTFGDKTYTGNR